MNIVDPRAYIAGLSEEEKRQLDRLLAPELIGIKTLESLPRTWQPRSYQLPAWNYLEGGGKRACLIWQRRSGKDDVALHWAAKATQKRAGEYWHMLPESSQ